MTKRLNLSGNKYNRLSVLSFAYTKKGKSFWNCMCDCGNEIVVSGTKLKSGHTKSCGCLQKEVISRMSSGKIQRHNLQGKRFGRLKVLKFSHKKKRKAYWLCLCNCGNTKTVRADSLKDGSTTSCGYCGYEFISGRPVSSQQRKIAEALNAQLNYPVGRMNIDIAIPERKIAIEYNGWHWHKNRQDIDTSRTIELLDDGWKVLCIKSNASVPDKSIIDYCISALSPDCPYQEIVMPDWGG